MLNKIWVAFILVGFVAAVVQLLQGDLDIFTRVLTALFDTAKTGFDISIGLVGIMSLWLGIMKIGEKGGLIELFGRLVAPFFRRVFPDIPPGHPASGSIVMNVSANMLGLDNAATPLGSKSRRSLAVRPTRRQLNHRPRRPDRRRQFGAMNRPGPRCGCRRPSTGR